MVFCTLFDSNYLDKGIALYQSLAAVSNDFRLYILAMDDKCHEVLSGLSYPNVVLISMEEFLTDELIEARKERTAVEFCWTCSAWLIDYVLSRFNEDICTYIDSDLFFFSSPDVLLNEINNHSVQIIEQKLNRGNAEKRLKRVSGTYCVEFNTFKKEKQSLALLNWWKEQCAKSCRSVSDKKSFGDQLYLENWGTLDYVHVIENPGAGIAPWNINHYRLADESGAQIKDKKTKQVFPIVFYHFHGFSMMDDDKAYINVYQTGWNIDDKLVDSLYRPYLEEIISARKMLSKEYGVSFVQRKTESGGSLVSKIIKARKSGKTAAEILDMGVIKTRLLINGRKNIFSC